MTRLVLSVGLIVLAIVVNQKAKSTLKTPLTLVDKYRKLYYQLGVNDDCRIPSIRELSRSI